MTDDELDRALFALPLEEPPVDLRGRIFATTIARQRLTVSTWEVWIVGTLVAFAVWLSFLVLTSGPNVGGVISHAVRAGIDVFVEAFSANTLVWMALGASLVLWISQLSFPQPRRETADR